MSDLQVDPYSPMAWFYDHWSELIDDVPFYVDLALSARGPIVELGAGTGRVSIPIAQAGRDVIAVDTSHAMLTVGRRKADALGIGASISFEQHDMRTFVTVPPTDLVISPFRSFLHMLTVDDQLAMLDSVRRSLKPGGRFACNFFTPDPAYMVAHDGTKSVHREFTDERGRRCEMWGLPRYDLIEQTLELTTGVDVYEGDRVVDSMDTLLRLRLVHRYEMEHLLARAGFEIEHLYGDFDEHPYGPGRTEMIWIARRP